MAIEFAGRHGRSTVVFYLPTLIGYTINLNAGTLMLVGGFLAWLYGQLIWRHGEAKARAHRAWVMAENESIRPRMAMAEKERVDLSARVDTLEEQLREAIAAERDIAIACLVNSGDMSNKNDDETAKTPDNRG